MSFVPNNIRFRSVSSKSIERFYSTKAYILNELVMEKNQFSEVARETLLLLFNSYSSWIMRVEYVFLNNHTITAKEVGDVLAQDDKLHQYHLDIFERHQDLFRPEFVQLWHKVNVNTRESFRQIIRGTEGLSHYEAYTIILGGLCTALQMCLQELYEVDCLLGSDFVSEQCSTNRSNSNRLVLYVDNFTLDHYYRTGVFMCMERIRIYSALSCGRLPVLIKNYSAEQLRFTGVIEGSEPLATLLKQCAEYVDIIDIESAHTAS